MAFQTAEQPAQDASLDDLQLVIGCENLPPAASSLGDRELPIGRFHGAQLLFAHPQPAGQLAYAMTLPLDEAREQAMKEAPQSHRSSSPRDVEFPGKSGHGLEPASALPCAEVGEATSAATLQVVHWDLVDETSTCALQHHQGRRRYGARLPDAC